MRYRFMRSILIILMISATFVAKSETLMQLEDSLVAYRTKVLSAQSDEERNAANDVFIQHLETTLNTPGAFAHPFAKLTSMCTLTSPDKRFRLFNWNVANADYTHNFYGYVLTNENKLIKLTPNTSPVDKPEFKTFTQQNWMGALYYEIILVKRNGKRFYTLLGWDGNNKRVTKKLIDVMSFSGKKIKFGASLFKMEKNTQKRVIFKFSTEITMSLKYDKKQKKIIFDHLAPLNENLEGIFDFYSPNMTYDELVLKGGKWVYNKDADVKGNPNERKKPYKNSE